MGTMNHRCDVEPHELGPYLLGHLDPATSASVAERVASCPTCASQVDELRPVVTAMAAVAPPDDQPEVAGPTSLDEGWERVTSALEHERPHDHGSWRRWLLAAAAVVIVVGLGVAVSARFAGEDDDQRISLAGAQGVSATAQLEEQPSGTTIDLTVRGLEPGEVYGVWLERLEGGRLPAGSFRPNDDGTAHVTLTNALPLTDSRAFGIALLPGGVVTDAVDVMSAALP